MLRAGVPAGPSGRLLGVGVVVAIGWLPVAILAATAGTAVDGTAAGGFLTDIGGWIRFFVVAPVAILAEPMADRVLGQVVALLRELAVPEPQHPRYDADVSRVQRLATSDTVELAILIMALVVPHLVTQGLPSLGAGRAAWYGTTSAGDLTLAPAGRWYAWVSMPLIEFLLLRWVWRSLVWWGFLWRTSRLPLIVTAAHPDRAGGLSFLALAPKAFLPLFMALSALGSAAVATHLRVTGARLADSGAAIATLVLLSTILLLVPQLFFTPRLGRAKRQALIRYGRTGSAMTSRFDARWTDPSPEAPGELLESAHASAMVDFGGTWEQVSAMRPITLSLKELLLFMVPVAAPFAPLLLFEYSVKEILTQVLAMVR